MYILIISILVIIAIVVGGFVAFIKKARKNQRKDEYSTYPWSKYDDDHDDD